MAGILSLGLIVYTFHNIKSFSDSHSRVLINQLIGLIFITYQSYKDYSRYTDDKILFSYSKPFNDHRQQLGVPIIPTSWRVAFKSSYSIEWDEKKDGVGHERKYIFMNADHTIEFESDDYKLSRTRADSERYVYVRYIYATGKHPDTLSFSYSNGDSAKSITKSIADSILNADHIQKDY
ncbi:hypothetical protein HDF24_22845 [Mucilaginibacter sp. X4EP1]|uniref:hypothetical protein n=1 Tax=Mucilaginibacter sp. X4EP1 TaxID=2723092 RepID=UPI002166D0B8|nr:hypothetical protein [Mucilaginibacter sp. X4EP1]MCS3815972.1 hypothetical protein [Mucilaginibacter sp. X4EP1]